MIPLIHSFFHRQLVSNSWSFHLGEDGLFRILRGQNESDIKSSSWADQMGEEKNFLKIFQYLLYALMTNKEKRKKLNVALNLCGKCIFKATKKKKEKREEAHAFLKSKIKSLPVSRTLIVALRAL